MSSTDLIPAHAVTLHDGHARTTSLLVAQTFGRAHKNVLRDIARLDCSPEYHRLNFEPMIREEPIGKGATRQFRYYDITKDGFVFLVMGYVGARAARFKEAYIARFNEMERALCAAPPAAHPALVAELYAARREWAKLARYRGLGLDNHEIGRLLRCNESTVRRWTARMLACGLLTPAAADAPQLELFGEAA